MARKKKRKSGLSNEELKRKLLPLVREVVPHHILGMMSKEYSTYLRKSRSDAEHEFWIKISRSTANLASGMEKWLEEWLDEDEGGK